MLRMLGLVLALALAALPALGADPVVFSAIGDVPYVEDEIADLDQRIANHNLQ